MFSSPNCSSSLHVGGSLLPFLLSLLIHSFLARPKPTWIRGLLLICNSYSHHVGHAVPQLCCYAGAAYCFSSFTASSFILGTSKTYLDLGIIVGYESKLQWL